MKRLINILFLLLLSIVTFAQRFPITVTTILTPPCTTSLSTMAESGSTQLMVNLLVNDVTITEIPVKLHVKMESAGITIESIPTQAVAPMFLGGGEARVLTGDDFAQYLNINNLNFKGFSKAAYQKSGHLPAGLWKFSITVRHFYTNKVISNVGTATAWITSYKPPVLTSPMEGENAPSNAALPLTFSWQASKHTGGTAAIMYRFEMWERRIEGVPAQAVAASVPPIFTTETAGLTATVLPATLALEPGMKYCWRVTAYDPSGMVTIENNGESEVRTFQYLEKCPEVCGLTVDIKDDTGYASWEENRQHLGGYNFEFYDDEGTCHKTLWGSTTKTAGIGGEYGKTWHVRVQGICLSDVHSEWSDWVDFKIPDAFKPLKDENGNTFECGKEVPERVITNFTLRNNLQKGDTIENRPCTTKFVIHSATRNEDGSFRGLSYVLMRIWGVSFLGEFDHLNVNTDGVIIGKYSWRTVDMGVGVVTPEDIEKWADETALAMAGATYNNTIKDTVTLCCGINFESIRREGNKYFALRNDTLPIEITSIINGKTRTLIKDADGHELVIDKDGEPMGVAEYKKCGGSKALLRENIKEKDSQVTRSGNVKFLSAGDYLFDTYDNYSGKTGYAERFPSIGEGDYRPAYACAESNTKIEIKAEPYENITFKNERGVPIICKGGILEVTARGERDTTSIYAYDAENHIIGKVNVLSYDKVTRKICLVPIGDTKAPDAAKAKQELDEIFKNLMIDFDVTIAEPIAIQYAKSSVFTHGGSGVIGVYNADQKAAISKLKERGIDNETVYLFFVKECNALKANDSPDVVNGYMPRGYQFGFIYNELNNYRTIAHEICHGAFHLKHTFDETDYLAPEKATDNLMDYNHGEVLNHWQWKDVHQPKSVRFKWLQEEEGAENVVDAVASLTNYEYAYIKKCSDSQSNSETLSTKNERYNVIGKKISGEYAIETIDLNYEESGLVTLIAEGFTDAILVFDQKLLVYACDPAPPIDIDICAISSLEGQEALIEKIDAAANNCRTEYVSTVLRELNIIAYSGNVIEFEFNGISYRLIGGQLQTSTLSDYDINNGNWEDGSIEQVLRIGKDANGILEIKALGFHKDLRPQVITGIDGKQIQLSANLSQIASHIKATANRYLKQNNVAAIDKKPESLPNDVFPGNQRIEFDGSSSCLKLVLKGVGIAKGLLKTAEFERAVYQTDLPCDIKMPAIATGTIEAAAKCVTDITSVVCFGYDIIFDDDVRHQTVDGFKVVADQVVDDPSNLFPLLGDIALEEVTGANTEQYLELVDESTDVGRYNHLTTKVSTQTIVSVVTSGKLILKLPEMAERLARRLSNAKFLRRINAHDAKELAGSFQERIRRLPEETRAEFLNDFVDQTDDVLRKLVENPELVDAWNIIKSGHPADCKKINVLQKVDELRKLPNRDAVGFTDDVITDIKGVFYGPDNLSTIPYEEVLSTCYDFAVSVEKNNVNIGNFSKIIGQLTKGRSFTAGAEWTVRYIGQHGGEFAGKRLNFEVIEEVGDKIRRVDLKVYDENLGKNIFYEFKSVKDVPPSNFLEQFGKDLANSEVSDLSQIKWIFDGKKVTQQQLTDAIKKTIDEWKVPEDVLNKWGYSKYQSDVFKTEVLYKDEIYREIFKSY